MELRELAKAAPVVTAALFPLTSSALDQHYVTRCHWVSLDVTGGIEVDWGRNSPVFLWHLGFVWWVAMSGCFSFVILMSSGTGSDCGTSDRN